MVQLLHSFTIPPVLYHKHYKTYKKAAPVVAYKNKLTKKFSITIYWWQTLRFTYIPWGEKIPA